MSWWQKQVTSKQQLVITIIDKKSSFLCSYNDYFLKSIYK